MTTAHIPSRSITTCDSCGVVMNGENSRKRASLVTRHHGFEAMRETGGTESQSMDLCDACAHAIGVAISKTALACAAAMNNPWPAPQPAEQQPV